VLIKEFSYGVYQLLITYRSVFEEYCGRKKLSIKRSVWSFASLGCLKILGLKHTVVLHSISCTVFGLYFRITCKCIVNNASI
jgi:hypothetical protein